MDEDDSDEEEAEAELPKSKDAKKKKKAKAKVEDDEDDDEENTYSDSDITPRAADVRRKEKKDAREAKMVKTKLSKPYNATDLTLRIPDGTGVKVGMRMKITSVKKPIHSETFKVHKIGSIILKKGLLHDYDAGSTIEQTHAMSGGTDDHDSMVNCTVAARRTNRRSNTDDSDRDNHDAASTAPSMGAKTDDESDISLVEALVGRRDNAHKIVLPSPLPTTPTELHNWHFDLVDICKFAYWNNQDRTVRFLNKGATLKYTAKERWHVPHDMFGLNSALCTAFIAALTPIKDLWTKIERCKQARRRSHPDDSTLTARVLMGYFYQYNAGLPHVSTLASTVNMMAIRFDSYGNNKLVEFWRRWVDLERDVGASMKPEMKIIKLYAEMNKFKNIKEEMLTFDKLPIKKKTYQAGYDALLDILEREAEREMNKVDDARALKPLETAMSGVNGPRDPKGLHYTDEGTPKDKGKGKKGKGGDSPPGKGLGKQNDQNSHKNSTEKGKGGKSDEKGKGKKGGKGDEGKGDPKGKGKKGKGGDKGKGGKTVKPEDVAALDALPKLEILRMCDMYTRHRHDNGPPCPHGAEVQAWTRRYIVGRSSEERGRHSRVPKAASY